MREVAMFDDAAYRSTFNTLRAPIFDKLKSFKRKDITPRLCISARIGGHSNLVIGLFTNGAPEWAYYDTHEFFTPGTAYVEFSDAFDWCANEYVYSREAYITKAVAIIARLLVDGLPLVECGGYRENERNPFYIPST